MKIFLVIGDKLHRLPETWNATESETLRIASKHEVTSDNVALRKVSSTEYEVNLENVEGSVTLVANDVETVIEVIRDSEDTERLEYWLEQNQLGYLIPTCKAIGWSKLKEATMKAKSISIMQGTEYALQELLKLLEIDDNVELERIWSDGDNVAYDSMHSAGNARKGLKLTNFLKLHYTEDDIDPWYDRISPASGQLTIALQDIISILSESIPATLRIKDIELIRLGLSLIQFGTMSMQSKVQYTTVDVDPLITIQTILQYEYLQFVYENVTNRYIRTADKQEPYDRIYAVQLMISCPSKFYNLTLHDDSGNQLCYFDSIEGNVSIIARPNVNSKQLHYRYRTEAGNLMQGSVNVRILKACGYLPVLQFNRITQMNHRNDFTDRHKLYEACLPALLKQYKEQVGFCDAKLPMFKWSKVPAGYVLYYIPINITSVYVNNGIETKEYEVTEAIPGYSLDRTKLKVDEIEQEFHVLWSLEYEGTYDNSVYYYVNEEIVHAKQEMRYLTEWINPFWTANIINDKLLSKSVTANGIAINNGAPLPNTVDNVEYWKGINDLTPEVQCNIGIDDNGNERFASMVIYSNTANLANLTNLEFHDGILLNKKRRPSIQMSIAKNIRPHLPYCLLKYDAQFDMYFNDKLIKSEESVIVFAPVKTGTYTIHVHNEWYDKTITIEV